MSAPLNISQPGLVLGQSIVVEGLFPSTGSIDNGGDADLLGVVITTAFNPANLRGALPTLGQSLVATDNEALYNVIFDYFGGQPGGTTFNLPSLAGAAIVGTAQNGENQGAFQGVPGNTLYLNQTALPYILGGEMLPVSNVQYGQHMQYLINLGGVYPSSQAEAPSLATLGTIYPFAGSVVPAGFVPCVGQLLPINQFEELFVVIGNRFGGDGVTNFQLPDFSNAIPVGAGGSFALGEVFGTSATVLLNDMVPASPGATAGAVPVSTYQPSLAINFAICTDGLYETLSTGGVSVAGQVVMFAGSSLPEGWLLCEGQQLRISDFQELYGLLGTQFGGDGQTYFALPDLRDRAVIGSGPQYTIGETLGQAANYITTWNLPEFNVRVPGLTLANDSGASGGDHVTNAFTLDVSGVWPGAQVQYSVNNGATWSASYQAQPGSNTVIARQLDVLGQASQASGPLTFVLDNEVPVTPTVTVAYGLAVARALPLNADESAIGFARGGNSGSAEGFTLSGIEAGAVVTYSIDGGQTWSEQFQAAPGLNSVQVRQTDIAGNISEASSLIVFNHSVSPRDSAQTFVESNAQGGLDITVETPGLLELGLGTAGVDTLLSAWARGIVMPSDIENLVLSGLGSGNTATGNALDNLIDIRSGSWIVDGGNGADAVQLAGTVAESIINQAIVDGKLQITVIGPNGKVVLDNVETLIFDDVTLGVSNDQGAQDLTALYDILLGRAPDATGLRFWQDARDNGVSLSGVADAILASGEYQTRVGAPSSREFVTDLYQLTLQRDPDAAGLAYWAGLIDAGQNSHGEVTAQIWQSAEAASLPGNAAPVLEVIL